MSEFINNSVQNGTVVERLRMRNDGVTHKNTFDRRSSPKSNPPFPGTRYREGY
jgi:hypothetical protein